MSDTKRIPVRASGRAIGVALLKTLYPYMSAQEKHDNFALTSRTMRGYMLGRIREEIASASASTIYNYAKQHGVAQGWWEDFSKSAGEAIGPKQEVPDALEYEIIEAMEAAINGAHEEAQAAEDLRIKELAEQNANEAAAKQAKAEARAKVKAEREAKALEAKEAATKKREEDKLQRDQEREAIRKQKVDDKTAKVEAAEKAVVENPDNKWQVENKSDGSVVSYHPTRKDASEAKKESENAEELKVVKIPA